MNAKKFSEAMGELDGKYIDEALSYSAAARRPHRFRRVSVALTAAVLTILLMGTAVAGVFGTQIVEFFTSHTESGYDLDAAIEKVPAEELSGSVLEVGGVIERQFKDYKAYYSWYPGEWQTTFSTRDKACEFIGFEQLKPIGWDLEEQISTLSILGNEEGQILSLNLETAYAVNGMRAQFISRVYTENYDEEPVLGIRDSAGAEFEESYYTTDSNKQCHIINTSARESDYLCLDGYVVDESVLYNLHIAYKEGDSARAMELMRQWADLL